MRPMLNDSLATALCKIMNAERAGKREVVLTQNSKMLKQVLEIMNRQQYLGSYEEVRTHQGGLLKVHLLGNINRCGVIKPRFSTKKTQFEKWEKQYLPAKDFGIIIVSTPQGMMTHSEAKEKLTGGKLIMYCY